LVTDASIATAEQVAMNSVVLFKSFDEPKVPFTGALNKAALEAFIGAESFPLVGEIGPDNFQKYVQRELPIVWMFLDLANTAVTDKVLADTTKAASQFKGVLSFVKLDGVRWAEHAKNFGLSGNTPGVVLEDRVTDKNYVFPESSTLTTESLVAHCQGYIDGTLAPTIKSEEVPVPNDGPVTVIVGKNFDSIVLDATKDVFVEFYAPWCGHCKSLAPKWDQLGEEFKDVDSVVIAKVDATANDTPADVKGFPTLIFYPANNKAKPITYSGDRSTKALIAFVRSKATTLPAQPDAPKGHDDSEL